MGQAGWMEKRDSDRSANLVRAREPSSTMTKYPVWRSPLLWLFSMTAYSNSFEFLKGSEVDFVSTGLNQGIIFNNPNAKVTCGCGESFSI